MKNTLFGLILFFTSSAVMAAWHNTSGTVTSMNFYSHTSIVLVTLSAPGESVQECSNKTGFAIDGSLPEDRRNQYISALLAAKASGQIVNIAYESAGGCVAYLADNTYRSIKRLTN